MERKAHIGHIDRPSQHNQEQDSLQQLAEQRPGSDPQPSCSSQVSGIIQRTHYAEANRRLEQFVEYFVEEFEAKLYAYHMILEGKTTKAGKFSDAFSEIIGRGVGGAAGGLVGFFLGSLAAGAKIGAEVGKLGGKKIGSIIGNKKYEQKVFKLSDSVDFFQNDNIKFRRELVEAGFDIFQSFEMQFLRVTTDLGPKRAIHKLAKDAVNRTINYMKQKKDISISESVILGDSKKETVFSKRPFKAGFKIEYEYQSSKMDWNTASLYGKAGIVLEDGSYYKQKGVKGGTTKYGYRRLLVKESWEKIKHNYDTENIAESKSWQFPLRYALIPKDLEKQSKIIIDKINRKDKNLEEDRIQTILEEVKEEIMHELDILNKPTCECIEDRNKLTEIITKVKNFKIDEYLENFKQYFEEDEQERQKITESFEAGRVENNENFIHLSHKQDIHHDDNKEKHKKTQEMIERVEEGIERFHIDFTAQRSKQTAEPVWFDVKNPVDSFTGRVEQLKQLHELLQSTSEKSISQIVSLTGLGGIGKTNLARKYAYDHRTDYDGNVIWINAETHQTLNESFLKLAQYKLGINVIDKDGKQKDMKCIIENTYEFFSERKSLFIFDNAEKFRTQEDSDGGIHTFLPLLLPPNVNQPYILITSRNQKWGNIKQLILDTFTPTESINFIKNALEINDESQENEIKKLTETLQHYPLALQQAVSYIKERVRALKNVGLKFEISDYLKRYDKEITKMLDFNFPDDSNDLYTKTTFTTWKITTNKIKENKEYGTQAGEILDIIAYLAPDGISVPMFLGLELIGDDQEQLGDAVQLLKQHSMVNSGQEETVLNVHRLVQEVTRIDLERQGKNEEIIQKAFGLLRTSFPYFKNTSEDFLKKREMLPHLEVFLHHLDNWKAKNPKNERKIEKYYLTVLIWMSDGYTDLGNPRRVKDLLERVLAIEEKYYGPDHVEVAIILGNLGNAYGHLGDPQKEKEFFERALAIYENHSGSDHVEVANAQVGLANAYGDLGDLQKKKDLLERALEIKEKYYGPDHVDVGTTLGNLGNAYGHLGDPQKQKKLLERALAINEKYYGPDHVEVARALAGLGNAYGYLGDPQKKKDLLERALAIDEKYYGPDHVEVAAVLVNLGNAYGDLGDPQKQKNLLERALAIKENHYGPDHVQVAIALVGLGNAYGDLEDPQKQKNLLERALAIKENHYGPDHVEVAIALVGLGNAYGDLGDPQKKKELLERALAIIEKYYGPDHVQVATTLINLGHANGDLGDPGKKKELLERALAIQEKYYGPDHVEVAITLRFLGKTYGDLGDPQKAYELYEKSSKIIEQLTPLHLATCCGDLKTVEYMLETGSDVFARSNQDTVLHWAVHSGNDGVVRLIVEKIKEKVAQNIYDHVNAKDTEGDTPLMWASEKGKTTGAKILLEYGFDLNVQNNAGETALHWAVKGGHLECVQLLLDSNADSNIQNNNGETPLILCQAKLSEDLDDENLQKITGLLLRLQTPESKPV